MKDDELSALEARVRMVLPEEYQERYEDVQPVSMGSASLKFDAANRVAWDEIWGHFCDLAMAGGPPHKGKLLEAASKEEVEGEPQRYRGVVEEICRGIRMVSNLAVEASSNAGWIRLMCSSEVMAGWLARAIAMENVSAHLEGDVVELPAGPHYRLEKEIKNVVTAVAKTYHYFDGHMEMAQLRAMAGVFGDREVPLLQPFRPGETGGGMALVDRGKAEAAGKVFAATGLRQGGVEYRSWLGLECADVRSAIWMMRALVVNHTMARREEQCLYVPIHPGLDPSSERVTRAVRKVHRLAKAKGI
jgi:hypothetical protein